LRLTVGGSAGLVWRGRGLVVTWICCIAVSFSLAGAALTIPRAGVPRIGEIASVVLHPDACSGVPGGPGRGIATGEVTGDLTDAAGRLARRSWFIKARHCSTGLG